MSIVNLKIIFVKKQKQTREQWRERPTQGRARHSFITEMAVFILETDYSCEWTIPLTLSVNSSTLTDSLSVQIILFR